MIPTLLPPQRRNIAEPLLTTVKQGSNKSCEESYRFGKLEALISRPLIERKFSSKNQSLISEKSETAFIQSDQNRGLPLTKNESVETSQDAKETLKIHKEDSDLGLMNFLDEEPKQDSDLIIKKYEHSITHRRSKGPGRNKRIILCKYRECKREFTKTWNFIDHARMHLGQRPYQ